MSTLAQYSISSGEMIVLGALSAAALVIVILCRVPNLSLVRGPLRFLPGAPVKPWLLTVIAGVIGWVMVQLACGAIIGAVRAAEGRPASSDFELTAGELAALSVIPPIVVAIAILFALSTLPRMVRPRLGLDAARIGRAIPIAIAASIVMLSLATAAQYAVEPLFRLIQFTHPAEHEILGKMTDASPVVKAALVFGAVLAAPCFEEIIFRGGIQTLLRRCLPDTVAGALLSIVCTSLLFAAFHPLWMAPAIITIGICLGYVYERTGNLWAAIFTHAIFNATSTAVFLFSR